MNSNDNLFLPENKHRKNRPHELVRLLAMLAAFLFFLQGCAGSKLDAGLPMVNLDTLQENIDKAKGISGVLEAESAPDKEERAKVIAFETEGATATSQTALVKKREVDRTPKIQPAKEGEEAPEGIQLNFDNADIFEVIQVIASTLGLNYIIDPQVKGVVNIRSGSEIPIKDLFAVFQKILHINGLDIRSEGAYDYIYVAKKAPSQEIYGADRIGSLKDSSELILQVVPLMYLSSAEAMKLVEPYLSEHGNMHNMEIQNTLLISDFESKVIDILVLLSKLDVSPLEGLHIKLVRVDNAPLFDLRDEVGEIFTALKINQKDYDGITAVPLERVNSIMLVSTNDKNIELALRWIKELDSVPTLDRDNIYIYNVRNSVASELGELINQLISEDQPQSRVSQKTTTSTAKDDKKPPENWGNKSKAKRTGDSAGKTLSSLRFAGEPVLFADDDRNIILIRALPADYTRIVKLLERLDNLPRQVLVEVMVAEVELSDELSLGIEWSLANSKIEGTDLKTYNLGTNFSAINSTAGLFYTVTKNTTEKYALLQALASENDLSILFSPHVLVLNNEQAIVNVGKQVPIVTSVTENSTTSSQVDKSVQYTDTGIILEVTPQINYNGIILLDVKQTVSNAQENTVSDISSPEISKRELKTKLAVKDGQSILMGGLIDKSETVIQSGVPFLKDIPYLGNLFKYQKNTASKTELLVMITPYVIESEKVLDQYIREFEEKISELRATLHKPLNKYPRKNFIQ